MNPEKQTESTLENTVKKLQNRPEQESYNPGVWRGDGVEPVLSRNEQKKLARTHAKQAKFLDVEAAREQAMAEKEMRIQQKFIADLQRQQNALTEDDEIELIAENIINEVEEEFGTDDEQDNEEQNG